MRYREMPAIPSTYTGYHGQLGLLMGKSTKQPDSLIIAVLASMGEEELDGTAFYPPMPGIISGYHRQFGLLMGESTKQPDSLIIPVLASIGEEEIDGPDIRRLHQPLYISPVRRCPMTTAAAAQSASH